MSDQNVREIQLGGKQLVFLFMTAVVLAVAIFLLGISVGRGVGSTPETTAAATDVMVTDPIAPGDMPPPTETTPADLSYHDQLQGQSPVPPPAEQPVPPVEPAAPPVADEASGPKPSSAASAAKPVATKPTADAARSGEGWFVQVNAFKSRANADRQASALRAKGYSANVYSDPGPLFRVRIGPFADQASADRTAQRVRREEGVSAVVQR